MKGSYPHPSKSHPHKAHRLEVDQDVVWSHHIPNVKCLHVQVPRQWRGELYYQRKKLLRQGRGNGEEEWGGGSGEWGGGSGEWRGGSGEWNTIINTSSIPPSPSSLPSSPSPVHTLTKHTQHSHPNLLPCYLHPWHRSSYGHLVALFTLPHGTIGVREVYVTFAFFMDCDGVEGSRDGIRRSHDCIRGHMMV